MHIPIQFTQLPGSAAALPRPHGFHVDLHRGAAPQHHPLHAVGTVLTRSLVWALIAGTVCASLLGLAVLTTAGTPELAPTHRPHPAHHAANPHDRTGPLNQPQPATTGQA